jgi:predicted transcriptional regulator
VPNAKETHREEESQLDVEAPKPQLDDVAILFGLLGMPTRLKIFVLIADDEHSVGYLAQATGVAATVASQHLRKLRVAGIVDVRRDGRRRYYVINHSPHALMLRRIMHCYQANALHARRPSP